MPSELIELASQRFRLDIRGEHGIDHWRRVASIGAALCEQTGANPTVVQIFAYLHDACREDEWEDPDHGYRAANWIARLPQINQILGINDYLLLRDAIQFHNRGRTSADPTIGTCWDADRLDLWRVGVTPAERWLSTPAGKDMLKKQKNESTILDYS